MKNRYTKHCKHNIVFLNFITAKFELYIKKNNTLPYNNIVYILLYYWEKISMIIIHTIFIKNTI